MKEKEPWDRFWGSGRIDDYLLYAGSAETPDIGVPEMVAMNNAAEMSGIGGVDTLGINLLPAIALQQEMNADAAVRDEEDFPR